MINSDKDNVGILKNIFKQLHKEDKLRFYPWKEYIALPMDLKEITIKKQNQFLSRYRSVLLPGFIDHADNVPMYMADDEEIEEIKELLKNDNNKHKVPTDYRVGFESLGISQYLKNCILSGDETPLFEMVYPPIDGTRETIVKNYHFAEALDFAEVFRGELARDMNMATISLVFDDPSRAIKECNEQPWEPHKRYVELKVEYEKMVDTTPTHTKRNRTYTGNHNNKSNKSSYNSYANAAKNNQNKNNENDEHDSYENNSVATTTLMSTTIDYNKQMDDFRAEMRGELKDTFAQLKKENDEMKKNIQEMKDNSTKLQNENIETIKTIKELFYEQKKSTDQQYTQLNEMFAAFMEMQGVKKTNNCDMVIENSISTTKRKLSSTTDNDTDKGNQGPVDYSGGRLTTIRGKNDS
jgi:hypothetical protein